MPATVYDPKKIATVLLAIEKEVEITIAEQCPDARLSLADDLDKAMEDFLSRYDLNGDEISFLCTQFAMLHLLQEVEKAKDLVIDVNNLRAFADFKKQQDSMPYTLVASKKGRLLYMGLALALMLIVCLCGLFLFSGYF